MPTVALEHISIDEKGVARISGTRTRIINVVLDVRNGLTPEQIHDQYPNLSLGQIHAALSYYYDHQETLDAEIERELREVQARAATNAQPTRDELIARLKNGSRS